MNTATAENKIMYITSAHNFSKIPGSPIAYWVSEKFINLFTIGEPIEGVGSVRTGMSTGNNDLYLRLWYEVCIKRINFGEELIAAIDLNVKPWIPYNKGGEARKWYGNNDYNQVPILNNLPL